MNTRDKNSWSGMLEANVDNNYIRYISDRSRVVRRDMFLNILNITTVAAKFNKRGVPRSTKQTPGLNLRAY